MSLSDTDRAIRNGADIGGWPRVTATRAAEICLRVTEPSDEFLSKLSGEGAFTGNTATRLGHELEPFILRESAELWWAGLNPVIEHGSPTIVGAQLVAPLVGATPVRLFAATPDARIGGELVEVKTVGSKSFLREWEGGKKARLKYELQVRWQCLVLDAPGCWLIALELGAQKLWRYWIPRDEKIEAEMLADVTGAYQRYIGPYAVARGLATVAERKVSE